jgi:AcrR family transcriptional regulator
MARKGSKAAPRSGIASKRQISKQTSRRLTPAAWIDVGIEALVHEGVEQVAIERLAKQLGVSKGSFYWHFEDRAALHSAMLDSWIKGATLRVRDRVDRLCSTPSQKILMLLELPFSGRSHYAAHVEHAIRAWGHRSAVVADAVRLVDRLRIDHLTKIFEELNFSPDEALARGHIMYAAMRYLGDSHGLAHAELLETIRVVHATVTSPISPLRLPNIESLAEGAVGTRV